MVCNADDTAGPWFDGFCISAEKQLSKYAEWTAPRAGMFLWLKLTQVNDSMDIFEELKAAKVVVVPGDPSHADRMRLDMSNTIVHTLALLPSRPYCYCTDGCGPFGPSVLPSHKIT